MGLIDVTAGFVIGEHCNPIWDDGVPVADNVPVARRLQRAHRQGASLTISFGGAAGRDLARTCHSMVDLVPAYLAVIGRFHPTGIDFDIEGEAIRPRRQHAAIVRRFAAIREIEEADRGLSVSLTVPVGPDGLVSSGRKLLHVAKQTKTRIDIVNLMTMDYGRPNDDMGGTALSAARGALAQVQAIWPHDTYAKLGMTPMIGENDTADETFTLSDAAEVAGFAQSVGLGRLAFWSLHREPCAGTAPRSSARNDCSGLAHDPLDFTRLFLAS